MNPAKIGHDTYQPEVDGLRAVAALGVIALHFGLLPLGWAGVWLFFVISGYVITNMLISSKWNLTTKNYMIFFKRRALRIWPLYFLMFGTLTLTFYLFEPVPFNYAEAITFATFTGNFYAMATTDGGHALLSNLWTISTEQQFYIVFPFIFAAAARYGTILVYSLVILSSMFIRAVVSVWLIAKGTDPDIASYTVYYLPFAHFDAFGLGALMASLRHNGNIAVFGRCLQVLALTFISAGIGLATCDLSLFLSVLDQHNGKNGQLFWIYCIINTFSGALLYTASEPRSILHKVMSFKPLVWIGTISYGVYLWHRPFVSMFAKVLPIENAPLLERIVAFSVEVSVILFMSAISYYWFEQLFHKRVGVKEPLALVKVEVVV